MPLDPNTAEPRRTFDVVVLVASLGGVEAVATVLDQLSADFPAAVLVGLHVGADHVASIKSIERRTKLPVVLAADGVQLEAGRVYLAPLGPPLTVLPDGTLSVAPAGVPMDFRRSVDDFLQSAATAYGAHVLAVVLTGMGTGGTGGVRAVKELGGTVLAQDEATSASFGMPGAAIDTGCVDLVLPIQEMGGLIDAVVTRGAAVPPPRAGQLGSEDLFSRGGHAGSWMRRIDWSRTPLGAVERWPLELRTLVDAMLVAPSPMFVCWGAELIVLYNDACLPSLGTNHPRAMGQSARACWSDLWDRLGPAFEELQRGGEPTTLRDQLLFTVRRGRVEEVYATFSLSPIRSGDRGVAGALVVMTETTAEVLQVRRLRMLRDLASHASAARSTLEACVLSAQVTAENPRDLPFALLYLCDPSTGRSHLAAAAGIVAGQAPSPHVIDLSSPSEPWPIADAIRTGEAILVRDVVERFRAMPCEPWGDSPPAALVAPIVLAASERPVGAAVLGVSPRRELDAPYRDFLDLVIAQIDLSIVNARSRQATSTKAETFAALDRVRTEFFDNVGNELRTPLTLMLGALEDLLARDAGALSRPQREAAELVQSSAVRLLDLVGALLDFSHLQAHRTRASFEPVDLAAYTRQLCSMFQEPAERSGVRLTVDCAALAAPVPVDREIWEKIVLNLLANALRSTSRGAIEVTLRPAGQTVELRVRDTSAGLPREELAHVFEPFRMVRHPRARTDGGAGIGLALVRDLALLHRGQVRVTSVVGQGTTFTVWVPASLPAHRHAALACDSTEIPNKEFARGVLRRIAGREPLDRAPAAAEPAGAPAPTIEPGGLHILVAEDDDELRAYVERLLSARWPVESVVDGAAALAAARARAPALVLADVRLSKLDGYELLRQLRDEASLGSVPVVLITAGAGNSVTEGLERGADEVLVKPFSARELCARVARQLERARGRPKAG